MKKIPEVDALRAQLRRLFLFGSVLVIVHKTESLVQGEYAVDPAYAAIGELLANPQNAMFALMALLTAIFAIAFAASGKGRVPLSVFAFSFPYWRSLGRCWSTGGEA